MSPGLRRSPTIDPHSPRTEVDLEEDHCQDDHSMNMDLVEREPGVSNTNADSAAERVSEHEMIQFERQLARRCLKADIVAIVDGAVEFDMRFLRSLDFNSFDPSIASLPDEQPLDPGPEDFYSLGRDIYILLTLGRDVGPGVTRAQFEHVMSRCDECGHFCYKERQTTHRCPDKISWAWKGSPEELFTYLLSRTRNTGLSDKDFRRLFLSCGLCQRICLARRIAVHECTSLHST
ncbi:hypothetical protein NMY22_g17495 [Coprinellus aureogranulatus]|nr:hypothetical protein NMY22_g17495 [Coprinellus aureogranulatus]